MAIRPVRFEMPFWRVNRAELELLRLHFEL
jgi:hypothetical protein